MLRRPFEAIRSDRMPESDQRRMLETSWAHRALGMTQGVRPALHEYSL
ncbi:MAG: hypothetical protein ACREX3_20335 [Gammaproteobacteria bacterium]